MPNVIRRVTTSKTRMISGRLIRSMIRSDEPGMPARASIRYHGGHQEDHRDDQPHADLQAEPDGALDQEPPECAQAAVFRIPEEGKRMLDSKGYLP